MTPKTPSSTTPTPEPLTTDVKRCQRCGQDHDGMTFQPLDNATGAYRWWAPCPTTGQPVMLSVRRLAKPKGPPRTDYTREELIDVCERGVVPMEDWHNRDSSAAQAQMGHAWALLRAGCPFLVRAAPDSPRDGCVTDRETVWISFYDVHDFSYFERGDDYYTGGNGDPGGSGVFYLPTPERLSKVDGKDWY